MSAPHIRFRIDFTAQCALGPGKIELLEGIARTGSLSQAAREMEMSYRRAWLLLDNLNHCFDQPLVLAKTGGVEGGGAELTKLGEEVIQAFRDLETRVAALASRQLAKINRHVRKNERVRARAATRIGRRKLVRRKQAV